MFGLVLISSLYQEISALADIRDADKAQIFVLEDVGEPDPTGIPLLTYHRL
jgi:hypothetical protein